MLEIGTVAPDFKLKDQNGNEHQLSSYRGKWVILYFYPKDMTPGCTQQACGMRDAEPNFSELDAVVFGISKDSEASHKKFESKHQLNFSLLSDPDTDMIKSYDALGEKSMFGKKYLGIHRISYIIDQYGKIAKAYPKVNTATHAQDLLNDLRELKK
jgi:peroxiredoxin Q/BCP